ncbi:MAG: AAC(3) family N-acetyltransferase, partial [Clostridia bacterium]|nr:AAC(3) family N-acetyltransferase [Clostridia bacterium]
YLHSVEERMDVPNRLSVNPVPTKIRLKSGDVIERPIRHHHAEGIKDVSARYPKYEPAFRYHGVIADGTVGNAAVQLCDARGMADVMKLVRERSGGIELMADEEPLNPAYYL